MVIGMANSSFLYLGACGANKMSFRTGTTGAGAYNMSPIMTYRPSGASNMSLDTVLMTYRPSGAVFICPFWCEQCHS